MSSNWSKNRKLEKPKQWRNLSKTKAVPNGGMIKVENSKRSVFLVREYNNEKWTYLKRDLQNANSDIIALKITNKNKDQPFEHLTANRLL